MKQSLVLIIVTVIFSIPTFGAPLKTNKQKISYLAAYQFALNMKRRGLDLDPRAVTQAINDLNQGRKIALTQAQIKQANKAATKKMQAKRAELVKKFEKLTQENLKRSQAFLKLNKKKKGIVSTKSGLQYKVIKIGNGRKPKATEMVTVNYRGTLLNGKEFDSSYKAGKPATIPLTGVIPGWREAVMLMRKGSKIKVFIPPKLAYGPRGSRTIGPNEVLIFDIELINIKKPKKS